MNMITAMRLDPKRNEKHEIYGYEEQLLLLNPMNIQAARYEPAVGKVIVQLTNGREILIDYTLKELAQKFSDATLGEL